MPPIDAPTTTSTRSIASSSSRRRWLRTMSRIPKRGKAIPGWRTEFDGDTARALASIRARVLIATATLDLYNPVECSTWAARHIADCELLRIDSPWGHLVASAADADGARQLNGAIREFLARRSAANGARGEPKSTRQ